MTGRISSDTGAPEVAGALAVYLPPLPATVPCGDVYKHLLHRPTETTLAVVDETARPIGLVNRFVVLSRYAQRFIPELYDRKPITALMEGDALIVDEATAIGELGRLVAMERPTALFNGFIVTSEGRYLGIGTGQALIRAKVTRDIKRATDLETALTSAAQARRAMSEFLALMSHELRTPLNAVIGFSDLLRHQHWGPIGDSRYSEYANDIHQAGNHLLGLISDILDLSKAEAGRLEIRAEPMDVERTIEECIRLVHERAASAGHTLNTDIAADLPLLYADRQKVKQMLLNLLSNAIKFTPAGGSITVAAEAGEDGLVLTVADTGIGMADQDIPTALAPFGQIDSSLGRRAQGTGLGLPLVKTMIALHDGQIDLKSMPRVGTSVSLRFPPERILSSAEP
jgi:two-component system, cell cycle sensor histidine kinase PleC